MIQIPATRDYKGVALTTQDIVDLHWKGVKYWCESVTTFYIEFFENIANGNISQTDSDGIIFDHLYGTSNPQGKETEKALIKKIRTSSQINDFYFLHHQEMLLILNFIDTNLEDIVKGNPNKLVSLGNNLLYHTVPNKDFFDYEWKYSELVEALGELVKQEKFDIFTSFIPIFAGNSPSVFTLQNKRYNKYVKKYFFNSITSANELIESNLKTFWQNKITDLNDEIVSNLVNTPLNYVGKTPTKLRENLKRAIVQSWPQRTTSSTILEPIAFSSKVEKIISIIFDYDKFIKKGLPSSISTPSYWQAYDLAERIGMSTCSYCNINYTHTIVGSDKNISRPDFDHFLIKSKYPLSALSFFNLIPSCKTCNSTLKGDIDTTLDNTIHPYIEQFGEGGTFTYALQDVYEPKIKIEVTGTSRTQQKINGSKKVFRLEEIYNAHTNVLRELIFRLAAYNEDYIKGIANTFNWRKEDLYQFVFNAYFSEDLFYKKPFSKMIKDIVENEFFYSVHNWDWDSTR